jgi:uncharacterized membrane protein
VERAASERPRGWWLVMLLALAVAAHAARYVVVGERAFVEFLAESFRARPWGIHSHAFFGAIALALGPFQFLRGVLVRRRRLHRTLGTIYVVAALGTGLAGLYMAVHSFGGVVTHLAFGLLGGLLVLSTLLAYRSIRRGEVRCHREWMIRSYALLFSAVTLRLEGPLLLVAFGGDVTPAYQAVSWLCWVPNALWAEWYVRRSRPAGLPQSILTAGGMTRGPA